ncbi:MAG TPA: tetratricopeptide repeat protein [Candidatus Polarisedimenticolia bacterium]|nr:tetratricopeptide repeat protein [Candidatus Polarisedimenticolia bacterium]
MPETAAQTGSDEAFRKGLAAMERRTYVEAASFFQSAIDVERQEGTKNPRMKYVSYLGLALTLASGRSEEGVKLCEQAVRREFFDPDLFCNLGIVYLRMRQKKLAFEAFQKGLNLQPGHRRIREELERYERRSYPVFTFLPRTHPVNVLAGRVRHRLRLLFHRAAATEA